MPTASGVTEPSCAPPRTVRPYGAGGAGHRLHDVKLRAQHLDVETQTVQPRHEVPLPASVADDERR